MVGRWNFLLIWSLFRGHSSLFGGVSSGKLTYIIKTSSSTVPSSLCRVWVGHLASPSALSRLADRSPVSAVSARSALCDRAIADGLGGSQEAMGTTHPPCPESNMAHSSCKNPPQICIGFVWSKKIAPNSTFIGFPDLEWGRRYRCWDLI